MPCACGFNQVSISINDEMTDLQMKLGAAGEAYFVLKSEVRPCASLELLLSNSFSRKWIAWMRHHRVIQDPVEEDWALSPVVSPSSSPAITSRPLPDKVSPGCCLICWME